MNDHREFIHLSDYDLVREMEKSSLEENAGRFVALRFEYNERLNELNYGPKLKQIITVIVLGLSLAALTVLKKTDFRSVPFLELINEFPKGIPIVIGLAFILGYFRRKALLRSEAKRMVHPSGFRINADDSKYKITGVDYLTLAKYVDPKINPKLRKIMRTRGWMLGRLTRKNLTIVFAAIAILFVALNAVLQQPQKPQFVEGRAPQAEVENAVTPTNAKIKVPARYSLVSVPQSKCLSNTARAIDCRDSSVAVFHNDDNTSENIRLNLANNQCLTLTISDNWYSPSFAKCSDNPLQKFTLVRMSDESVRVRFSDKGCLALQSGELKLNKCDRDPEAESFILKAVH